ncbi:hypothetical protein MMC13_003696 [Lambiella insularis]|nr:hypothetical protein [Lambiella insularis]
MPRGGGSRPPVPRDVMISKKISYVLRHGAEKEGLKLDRNGYANCADLLAWRPLHSLALTFPELQSLVASNDKQRFQLIPSVDPPSKSPDPSHFLIRASQGHSLAIASEALLTPILPSDADFPLEVVHGTIPRAWKLILKSGGLSRMGRRHIHFATGVPGAEGGKAEARVAESGEGANTVQGEGGEELQAANGKPSVLALEDGKGKGDKVISGMRKSASVLVWVDVKRSVEEGGLKWWRSSNGVILTEGDERGMVRLEFVSRVEGLKEGEWRGG